MQNKADIAHQFLDSLSAGTPDDFLIYLTDDVEIHVCLGNQLYTDSYAATFIGKNGVHNLFGICKQFLEFSTASTTDFHYENEKMIVRGDFICVLTTSQITWTSSWMQIWTFSGDHISKLRIFADFHTLPNADFTALEIETGPPTPKPSMEKHSFFS